MFLVATIGKYHRPSKIISNTRSKRKALEIAKKYSEKYGIPIGIWEYTKSKWYGLIKVIER